MARKELGREERCHGRRGQENHRRFSDLLLEQAIILMMRWREERELGPMRERHHGRGGRLVVFEGVEKGADHPARALEVAIDDVDVVDVIRTEEDGEPDVPVCLLARAEDSDIVHRVTFLEDHDGR